MRDPTRRERAIQAVCAALVAGVEATVRRNREVVDATEAPFVNVREGGHSPDYENLGLVMYDMALTLELVTSAPTEDDLGPIANALYGDCLSALMADPTLGGVCIQVREAGYEVVFATAEESGRPVAEGTLELSVTFITPDGDPAG